MSDKPCFPWLLPLLTWNLIVSKSHSPKFSFLAQKAGLSFVHAFELKYWRLPIRESKMKSLKNSLSITKCFLFDHEDCSSCPCLAIATTAAPDKGSHGFTGSILVPPLKFILQLALRYLLNCKSMKGHRFAKPLQWSPLNCPQTLPDLVPYIRNSSLFLPPSFPSFYPSFFLFLTLSPEIVYPVPSK